MAIRTPDRVREVTTTTGTGPYTLEGAVPGRRAFGSVLPDGREVCYCVEADDTSDFEVGIGIFRLNTNTIERQSIITSSNNDNPVAWGAGSKAIFASLSETLINTNDSAQNLGTWTNGNNYSLNRGDGNLQEVTIAGDVTIDDFVGIGEILLTVKSDGVGGHTINWPSHWEWIGAGAPAAAYLPNQAQVFKIFRATPGGTVYAYEEGADSVSLGSQGENFTSPGTYTVDVPVGLKNKMTVYMRGAGGGASSILDHNGGSGAALKAVLDLTNPDVLTLLGLNNNQIICTVGAGGIGQNNATSTQNYSENSGGGLTGIQLNGYILIAGSGGGNKHGVFNSYTMLAGAGGYPNGFDGKAVGGTQSWQDIQGKGGTQTSGGAGGTLAGYTAGQSGTALTGGNGASGIHGAGEGGDGYYGGGGGATGSSTATGGGGSSFHNASIFGTVVDDTSDGGISTHNAETGLGISEITHYSGYEDGAPGLDGNLFLSSLSGQRGIAGGNGGDGQIVIIFE